MSDTLTTIISLLVKPQLATAFGTLAPEFKFNPIPLTHGTAINQADVAYLAEVTATTGTTTLDLIGGGLVAVGGAAFGPAKIVGVGCFNTSTTEAEIVTVGGGTNGWNSWLGGTSGVKVGPNGLMLNVNPSLAAWGLTASTADLFPLTSASGSPVVRVCFLARTA